MVNIQVPTIKDAKQVKKDLEQYYKDKDTIINALMYLTENIPEIAIKDNLGNLATKEYLNTLYLSQLLKMWEEATNLAQKLVGD